MKKVLVIDDEEAILALYVVELESEGYEVFAARSGEEALAMVDAIQPDLVTLDIRMAGMNGVEVLRRLKEKRVDLPVVINTAYPSYKEDFNVWASDAYVVKSSDVRELLETVRKILMSKEPSMKHTLKGEDVNRKMALPLLVSAVLLTAPAYGGMMEHMHEHMQQHMGGGMTGMQSEGKGGGPLTVEAEQNGVTVKATYNNPGAKEAPEFTVKLDSHSVDLDAYRLEEMTVLRDEKGQEHVAELVSTSGSGHHREAVLRFNGVDLSGARSVEVIIKGLADVEARAFRFDPGQGKKETGGSKHQH